MRKTSSLLFAAYLFMPAHAMANTPSDLIRDLARDVPFETVKNSPNQDISSRFQSLRERSGQKDNGLAVPDLDMVQILRDRPVDEILMDPRILSAIAGMPKDRASEVLRMIEDRKAGIDPLSDIPPLSRPEDMSAETDDQSLSLRGWNLIRDENGRPMIRNGADRASSLLVTQGMVLGDFGRVLSLIDEPGRFEMTLETGDILSGSPLDGSVDVENIASSGVLPSATPIVIRSDDILGSEGQAAEVVPNIRPRPRPENLSDQGRMENPSAVVTSLRPVPRPADLMSKHGRTVPENTSGDPATVSHEDQKDTSEGQAS